MRPDLANDVLRLTGEHLVLVASSMAVAILLGVPAGILLTRRARLRKWLLGFAGVVQTIPSLALFGFLIPIPLDRRDWVAHCYCGPGAVCAAADYAQHVRRASSPWMRRCANRPWPWE